VDGEWLTNDGVNTLSWVKRGVGVLEHHLTDPGLLALGLHALE
jgi:hypothetical protein